MGVLNFKNWWFLKMGGGDGGGGGWKWVGSLNSSTTTTSIPLKFEVLVTAVLIQTLNKLFCK